MAAEQLNGRLAMMGIVFTTLLELFVGHPVVQAANIHSGF
jgi:hypothetical protein